MVRRLNNPEKTHTIVNKHRVKAGYLGFPTVSKAVRIVRALPISFLQIAKMSIHFNELVINTVHD